MASIWGALDAACVHEFAHIEVPSLVGREVIRMAWIWALNSLTVMVPDEEMTALAVDLAWLGAPPIVALHVAAADRIGVDQFVTVDPIAQRCAAQPMSGGPAQ